MRWRSIQLGLLNRDGLAGSRQITLFGFFSVARLLEFTQTDLVFANQGTNFRVIDVSAIGVIVNRTFRILL